MSTAEVTFRRFAGRYQPRQLSLLLTTIAVALWAFSIATAKLATDDWGIIHSLPVIFFIALGLLTIASAILWLSHQDYGKLLFLQLCLFITMLWLTPLLLGGSLVFGRDAYVWHDTTEYILRYGHLDAASQWYHNWPGFDLVETSVIRILGIENPDLMLKIAPFLMQFILLGPLYIFFRNTIGRSNYSWAAIWLFYLGNWTGQYYFSPQSFGFLLLITVLALLTKSPAWAAVKAPGHRFLEILVFAGLTIAHLLTSIAGLFIVAALWLARVLRGRALLVLLVAVFVAGWTIYGAIAYTGEQLLLFLERAFRLEFLWGVNIAGPVAAGSAGHQAVCTIRIAYTALFVVIGLAGVFLSRKFKSSADRAILAIGAGIVLMIPFSFYGSEYFMRAFFFMLPVIGYFGVKLLKTRISALILVLFLLAAIPFSIISLHGNQALNNITSGEVAYWHFLRDETTEGDVSGGIGFVTLGYTGRYSYRYLDSLKWKDDLLTGDWLTEGRPQYICLSQYDQSLYEINYNDPQFVPELRSRLNNSAEYNLIYTNSDVSLYIHESPG